MDARLRMAPEGLRDQRSSNAVLPSTSKRFPHTSTTNCMEYAYPAFHRMDSSNEACGRQTKRSCYAARVFFCFLRVPVQCEQRLYSFFEKHMRTLQLIFLSVLLAVCNRVRYIQCFLQRVVLATDIDRKDFSDSPFWTVHVSPNFRPCLQDLFWFDDYVKAQTEKWMHTTVEAQNTDRFIQQRFLMILYTFNFPVLSQRALVPARNEFQAAYADWDNLLRPRMSYMQDALLAS